MASLTPAPTSMIDRLEKYLLSCLQGENFKRFRFAQKSILYMLETSKHYLYKTILPYLVKKTLSIVLITQKLEIE